MIIQPPFLRKGATIGITCPAGYMPREKADACIQTLQQWGFEVMVGRTLGSGSENYFSGTDAERRTELQAMLDSDRIDAILFGRGGYGVSRIIDQLRFQHFRKHPKWLIGYSDITLLHCHIHRRYGIATLHAPMAAAFNDTAGAAFVRSIYDAVTGRKPNMPCTAHPFNRTGTVEAPLVGGNLALLTHSLGTPSALSTRGKILFIEDIGEYVYSIDRMMQQLRRSGQLSGLAGLLVGGFTDTKDTQRPFGQTVYELIRDLVKDYEYPVAYGFPVSHSPDNYALKIGVTYRLKVQKSGVSLREC